MIRASADIDLPGFIDSLEFFAHVWFSQGKLTKQGPEILRLSVNCIQGKDPYFLQCQLLGQRVTIKNGNRIIRVTNKFKFLMSTES